MFNIAFATTPLLLALVVTSSTIQGGKKKWDFKESVKKAQEAFDSKSYGSCLAELKTSLAEVSKLHAGAISAALPPAPDGFTEVKQDRGDANFGMLGFLGAGMELKKEYRKIGEDSSATVRFSVYADSPMAAGPLMMMSNPILLANEPNAEIVKFGPDKGIIRTNEDEKGGKAEIVIGGTHVVNVEWDGLSRAEAEPFFSEAVIRRIAETLNK